MLLLPLHIAAGALALVFGYAALYAPKASTFHRRSGILFVSLMLPMAATGIAISAANGVAPAINIPAALLVIYLVVTSLMTIRPPAAAARLLGGAGALIAGAIGTSCVALAIDAIASGGRRAGLAFPLLLFAGAALSGCAGDLRLMRARGIGGSTRLARHLWRMCFALFIAAISLFSSAARVPAPSPLRALPVLAVLVTMFYWLWRIRGREAGRPVAGVPAPETV